MNDSFHNETQTDAAWATPVAPAPLPADVGIVAALSIEVGFLVDQLKQVRKYTGPKHTIIEGEAGGKLIALVITGMGRKAASQGTQLLLDGHRPRRILSVGFAGALSLELNRHDLVIADEVVDLEGARYSADPDLPSLTLNTRIRVGKLLTVDQIVAKADEKLALHQKFGADIVDMESSAVAAVCNDRNVKFHSIRVVSDDARKDLPPEVVSMATQSGSYRVGAAIRAIWKRPSSLKDFWALHEQAQEAADRLAKVTIHSLSHIE